jgi:hypothetical protein
MPATTNGGVTPVRNTSSLGNLTLYGTALFVSTIYARRASLLITVKRRSSRGYLNFNFFFVEKGYLGELFRIFFWEIFLRKSYYW